MAMGYRFQCPRVQEGFVTKLYGGRDANVVRVLSGDGFIIFIRRYG